MDNVTLQVLTVILTITGLGLSVVVARRRGIAAGVKGVALSLLPLAALLTGTFRLLWEIADSVVEWAVRLVFSPFVWLGIIVAGVSAALFVTASFMSKRGVGVRGRAGAERPRSADKSLPTRAPADDDLADIEDILKKHGIS